tara:strand:+ start:1177 stop:1686 length:510 start_codon:yes stop_codon:yes gene_type:complete
MTAIDFLANLERYYSKEYEDKQVYINMLGRFTQEELDQILPKVYAECQWLPKINQIFTAAKDLMIQIHEKSGCEPDQGCSVCRGTGWEVIPSYEITTGDSYESVRRCLCSGLPQPKPHVMGNGWVSEFNGNAVTKRTTEEQKQTGGQRYGKQDAEDSFEESAERSKLPF